MPSLKCRFNQGAAVKMEIIGRAGTTPVIFAEEITVWTIGHSTRTRDEFMDQLSTHEIQALADVRRFPASRKYPYFNAEALCVSVLTEGIEYVPFPELGGRRRPLPHSRNTVWRNESFRGYADYMETDAFHRGIERLLKVARAKRTALMCAEAVWWRCHRALVSDYLKASGVKVIHIFYGEKSMIHPYTSAARIVGGQLDYAGS